MAKKTPDLRIVHTTEMEAGIVNEGGFDDRVDIEKRSADDKVKFEHFRELNAQKRAEAKANQDMREANQKIHTFVDSIESTVSKLRALDEESHLRIAECERLSQKKPQPANYLELADKLEMEVMKLDLDMTIQRLNMEVSFPPLSVDAMKSILRDPNSGLRSLKEKALRNKPPLKLVHLYCVTPDGVVKHTGLKVEIRTKKYNKFKDTVETRDEQVPTPEETQAFLEKMTKVSEKDQAEIRQMFADTAPVEPPPGPTQVTEAFVAKKSDEELKKAA